MTESPDGPSPPTHAGLATPASRVVRCQLRVRYKDTDCMRVVYYGNYLTYFEVGRVEYLREAGMPISDVNEKVYLPVVEATVRYVRPAMLDELLDVRCWVSERKRASFTFSYEIRNAQEQVVATGFTRHACTDPESGKMVGVPVWLQSMMVGAPC